MPRKYSEKSCVFIEVLSSDDKLPPTSTVAWASTVVWFVRSRPSGDKTISVTPIYVYVYGYVDIILFQFERYVRVCLF